MSHKRKLIGITMGDPAGIGAEVVVKALANQEVASIANYLIIGSEEILRQTCQALSISLSWNKPDGKEGEFEVINSPDAIPSSCHFQSSVTLLDSLGKNLGRIELGCVSPQGGAASVRYIEEGISLALSRKIDAIVTAPINKEAIHKAGYGWPGHTELLAAKTNTKKFTMMLVGGGLKVSFVTIHVALKDVPGMVVKNQVIDTINVTNDGLKRFFGIRSPRLAVCGLNPHAGEAGRFGDEEKIAIYPAIEELRAKGVNCVGPVPPDTVFHRAVKGEFDAVVSMYHDQGTIPVKLLGFETGVNVTLGLPIIRTSPDHGTAYDIAGRGVASPDSMIEAIKLAVKMATVKFSIE